MRILHITKKYPGAVGGDAVVVSQLKKHQEAAGHEVSVLTSNCAEIERAPEIYRFGLRDSPSRLDAITPKRLVSLLMLVVTSFFVIRKVRPEVIHTHSVDMAFAVSLAARILRVPMIHTFHIVTFYDQAQLWLRRRSELLLAKMAGFRLVTAPNLRDVAALSEQGLRARLLENGVDLDFWQHDKKEKGQEPFTFISVGRLEEQKGYEYLVRAAGLLRKKTRHPFRVIIVGDGSQYKKLRQLARECRVGTVIEFVGQKSLIETRELLGDADAAVFSSLYETTPLTLLEAWAMELPVIITPVGIIKEQRDDAPVYLADIANERALFEAMAECMDDPVTRLEKATLGAARARDYSWDRIARQTDELYGEAA